MKKKGKGEGEKGEKGLKNASLRVKNSKIFAGGPIAHPPPAGASLLPARREKKYVEMYNIYP